MLVIVGMSFGVLVGVAIVLASVLLGREVVP